MGSRVLVVDDDPNIRSLIAVTLRRAGFEIEAAQDGTTAMTFLRNAEFDVIVLDLMMPRMSGWQLLDLLRGERPKDELPRVVIVSAAPTSDVHAMPDPVSAVLTKPFDVGELVRTVKTCIA